MYSEESLISTIGEALSGSKASAALLEEMEGHEGYATTLLTLATSPRQPPNVRLMSAIVIKNAVNRRWRKRGKNSYVISDYEKDTLKETLLKLNTVEDNIGLQLDVITASIARSDWPAEWPDLFPSLVSTITKFDGQEKQTRAFRAMHQVLKVLSSKRLTSDKTSFRDLAHGIFGGIGAIWIHRIEAFVNGTHELFSKLHAGEIVDPASVASLSNVAAAAVYSSKILYRLVVHGYPEMGDASEIVTFFSAIHENLPKLVACLGMVPGGMEEHHIVTMLKKTLKCLGRCVVESQMASAKSFQPFVSHFLSLFHEYIVGKSRDDINKGVYHERFMIQCFTFICNIIDCTDYRVFSASSEEMPDETENRREEEFIPAISSVLTEEAVCELTKHIISAFFPLTTADIAAWMEDGEAYYLAQQSVTKEEAVRPAAEYLYITLMTRYRYLLAPMMGNLVKSIEGATITDGGAAVPETVFLKDAVYYATGLSAYDLHDQIIFIPWFMQSLVPILQLDTSSGNVSAVILQRRVIWLISCWATEISSELRPSLYNGMLHLLNSPDIVGCLCAITTINSLVEDWNFECDLFEPFMPRCVGRLYVILSNVEELEVRQSVMAVVASIVDRMPHAVKDCVNVIVDPLPAIWQGSDSEQNLLRQNVISILKKVVEGLGPFATSLYPLVTPILSSSCNVQDPCSVYLMADALDLWSKVINSSTTYTNELAAMFPTLATALDKDVEHAKAVLLIIESYCILGGMQFMVNYSGIVRYLLEKATGEVRPEVAVIVIRCVESILSCFPSDAPELLDGVLKKMLQAISFSFNSQGTPHLKRKAEAENVIIGYLSVFCRLVILRDTLFQCLLSWSGGNQSEAEKLLMELYHSWIYHFDDIAYSASGPWRRKTWSLALCSLIHLQQGFITERVNEVLSIAQDVVSRIEEEEASLSQCLPSAPDDPSTVNDASRKREMMMKDPIFTIDTKVYVAKCLKEGEGSHGSSGWRSILASCNAEAVTNLSNLLLSVGI